jgi:peptidoglycan/LPS O-acetylase OafA/YrhL
VSKHIRQFEFAWGRLAFLSIAIIFSSLIGWFGQPLISNNTDAINTIVTIFSILAGFLIAVITFIAEPALARAKNWEELQKLKPLVEKKLARQSILFVLYLATLGLALLMFLVPDDYHNILVWFERAFLALAIFIFILSFTLPGSLMKIQMERYESILESSAPQNLQRDSKDQQV